MPKAVVSLRNESQAMRPFIPKSAPVASLRVSVVAVKVASFLFQLPAQLLLSVFWIYRKTVSPVLPLVFGPACGCRFSPTCSHYAVDAVRTRGAIVGLGLTLVRLIKCSPLHPGGFDPVSPRSTKFSCVNVPKATPVQG